MISRSFLKLAVLRVAVASVFVGGVTYLVSAFGIVWLNWPAPTILPELLASWIVGMVGWMVGVLAITWLVFQWMKAEGEEVPQE